MWQEEAAQFAATNITKEAKWAEVQKEADGVGSQDNP